MKLGKHQKHRLIVWGEEGIAVLSVKKRRVTVSDLIADLGDHKSVVSGHCDMDYFAWRRMYTNDKIIIHIDHIAFKQTSGKDGIIHTDSYLTACVSYLSVDFFKSLVP